MADDVPDVELLFFDTFSHENAEELNLDLVQFPSPVIISEVRVIPLQTRVQADVPGGVRLGATNPSNFKLELFVNNLSKPNSSVFERLGLLDYRENQEILYKSEKEIPTDGLILKGWYNTITVAIYGQLTVVKADRTSPPPPPPPQPKATKQTVETRSGQQSETSHKEWEPPRQTTGKPQQQHPLDYIQQQVELQQHQQKQQQQQAHGQITAMTHPPPKPVPPSGQQQPPSLGLPHTLSHAPPQPVPPPSAHLLSQPLSKTVPSQQPPDLFRNVDPAFDPSRPPPSTNMRLLDNREGHFDPPTLTREGARDFPTESRDQYDNYEDRQRDGYDFRGHRDQDSRERDFDRSRDSSRDSSRDRDIRDGPSRVSKEKERKREWEKFREREREREAMKDKTKEWPLSPSRSWSRSRSKSRSRSRSYSRSPRRNRSRSRSVSRSPDRRSWTPGKRSRSPQGHRSRSPQGHRSRSPPSLRSRSPTSLKSRSPPSIRSRSPPSRRSRSPPRRSFSPPPPPPQQQQEMHPRSPVSQQIHKISPILTPRSPCLQTPMSPESRSLSQEHEFMELHHTQSHLQPLHEQVMMPSEEEEAEAGEIIEGGEQEMFMDPMSPEQSQYISDGEIQDADDAYENISSDDEFPEIEDISASYTNLVMEDMPEDWSYNIPTFNPLQSELTPLVYFKNIALTKYELEKEELLKNLDSYTERPVEAQSLIDMIEEFTNAEHHEKWIESLEGVPALLSKGLVYLLHKEKKTDVLETIVDWTLEGLDSSKAMSQPESAYKVRHLKMGIKLAGSMCCCDPEITVKCISRNLQHKLLDLLADQYMSFSLKLQILVSLDKTTRFKDGVEWFLGTHPLQKVKSEIKTEDTKPDTYTESCYVRFINVMLKKQVVRVSVGMTALLRKLHVYEVMRKLNSQIESVVDNIPPAVLEGASKLQEDAEMTDDDAMIMGGHTIPNEEIKSIITALSEITKVITLAPHLIAQPKRTLPGKVMFEVALPPYDPYPNLFHLADSSGLLEGIFVLLSTPATSNHMGLFSTIKDLLETLVKTQKGLMYLTSKPELTSGIMKALIQSSDFNKDDPVDESPLQQLGMELINYLHSFLFVDQLLDHHSKEVSKKKDVESEKLLTLLRHLLSVTFTPAGKEAVVHVLGLEENLLSILPFLERTGQDEGVINLKKSACAGYSVGLLLCLVRNTQSVLPYDKFNKRLVTISEDDFSSRLSELQEWLSPLKSLTSYNCEGVSAAVSQLKHLGEDLQKIPRSLVTVIRVLKEMTVPPETRYPDDTPTELKYKFALLEVYGSDCFPILINVLQKTSELLLRSWQEGIPQSADQMAFHISIIKPTLQIVKTILLHLILARGSEFRDLTALPVLFEVFTIFCSVPMSAYFTDDLMEIQKHIIDTLLGFTQPMLNQSETEEALSQSLWTLSLKELFKYTLKAPYTYLSGLLILSELLPLPLPLQAQEALSEEEVNLSVTTRKLWSAHLHSLTQQIQEVIQKLGISTCQPVQQVLRRICWQLSDLSSLSAVMVTKTVLNMVVDSFSIVGGKKVEEKKEGEKQEDKEEIPNMIASPFSSKMLNLLAFVVQQPAIKCAMLQLTSKTEGEEVYKELIPNLLEILNTVCDTSPHIQAQECVVSIIQSLCDLEVSMVAGESVPVLDQIAYSLPPADYMSQITAALLDHMCNPDHSYASILPCVRTLVMLTDHDYGFYHLKSVLEQKTTVLGKLMVRINTTFSKDSSDCLSTLSTLLEFLRLLVSVEVPGMEVTISRTYTLSLKELQEVLSWKPSMENHPLLDLEKLLEDCAKEDETLDSLLESMVNLMKTLRETTENQEKPNICEPPLPPTKCLTDLFNSRSVYVLSNMEDEHLNATYWLANPVLDEADIEPALIAVDMEDICRKYMPDFNLEEELKKSKQSSEEFSMKPRRIKHGSSSKFSSDRRASKEININRGRGFRRPFVAPMRGRGIARGLMNNANRSDNFRSRPPNTSRPPSMHVDDFMKLEKGQNDQQESQIPTTSTLIRRSDKHKRLDISGRGGMNNYSRPKFESPHPFGRGGGGPSSDDRRGGRDFHFSPRGSRGYWPRGKEDRFMGRGFRGRRDDTLTRKVIYMGVYATMKNN
ncbi:hypothetical protein KUTeg_019697 [Tegillarca granosa]|uniref:Virilizer N-terminal domain-containing protein n=1 Tax=Tegillarca granosa TaxID=220873 RepID=A0ABQ9EFU7_TEGGR|nr:hypothetical protein KUTeg_019697 [Tegillarca granosa]